MTSPRDEVTRKYIIKLLEAGRYRHWISAGQYAQGAEMVSVGGFFEEDTLVVGTGPKQRRVAVAGISVVRTGEITVDLANGGTTPEQTLELWPDDESTASRARQWWQEYQQELRFAGELERILAWCLGRSVQVSAGDRGLRFDFGGYVIRVTVDHLPPELPPATHDLDEVAAWCGARKAELAVEDNRLVVRFDGFEIKLSRDHLPALPASFPAS